MPTILSPLSLMRKPRFSHYWAVNELGLGGANVRWRQIPHGDDEDAVGMGNDLDRNAELGMAIRRRKSAIGRMS